MFLTNGGFVKKLAFLPLVFLMLTVPARAHHDDPTLIFNNPAQGLGVTVTTAALSEFETSLNTPQIVVGLAYRGIRQPTEDHHVYYQRFRVSFQMVVDDQPTLEDSISSLRVNIVPIERFQTSHDGTTTSRRYLAIQGVRDRDSGLLGGASVHALGWSLANLSPLVGDAHENQTARLVKFAQLAVDLVGLQYAYLSELQHMVGGSVGTLQALGGIGLNITRNLVVRISAGAFANFAMGSNSHSGQLTVLSQMDFFNRLEVAFNNAYLRVSLFADIGIHSFNQMLLGESASGGPSSGGHHHEGNSHSHGYLFLGMTVSF